MGAQTSGFNHIVSIAVGRDHTLALRSDGTVWAWGYNVYGQVGNGSTATAQPFPVPVKTSSNLTLSRISAVSAGVQFSVALGADGTVWTWGFNDQRQLGDGTAVQYRTTAQPIDAVSGLSGVSAVAAGGRHVLVLKWDGTVWGWGWNEFGQLGDGTNVNRAYPVRSGSLQNIVAIDSHSRTSGAVDADGKVWLWGRNDQGQAGDPSKADWLVPRQLPLADLLLAGFLLDA